MPAFSEDNSDQQFQSRRKHPRALVDWPVTLISSTRSYQGKAANISRGGALIHLAEKLNVGDIVRLAFEVPDYQDVIVARGEILQVFPLEVEEEPRFSHGIALKFTEISNDSLKFFSGNLAPEWKDGYIDRGPTRIAKKLQRTDRTMNYLPWFLVFILLLPLSFFLYDYVQRTIDDENSVIELDKRLIIIERQIKDVQDSLVSYNAVERQINDIHLEIAKLRTNLSRTGTFESTNRQGTIQDLQNPKVSKKNETNNESISAGADIEKQQEKDHFYVVKSGDNLTQISQRTGITIRELELINNIDSDTRIFPGQKLKLE